MQKITDYIFGLSAKNLAVYLVVGPLVLFLIHTIASISYRNLVQSGDFVEILVSSTFAVLIVLLALIVFLWLFWLRGTVFSLKESNLGLAVKWFRLAFVLFILYLTYNFCYWFVAYIPKDFRHFFYSLNEFVAFAGLLVAYPTICHFSGRAIYFKIHNEKPSFLKSLPYTLLLIFIPISVPFFHRHFSDRPFEKSRVIKVYAFAAVLFIMLLIGGFIAAITGLV